MLFTKQKNIKIIKEYKIILIKKLFIPSFRAFLKITNQKLPQNPTAVSPPKNQITLKRFVFYLLIEILFYGYALPYSLSKTSLREKFH